ncbi:MAG: hypothetical protein IT524_08660 [Nitrosomonas sp.]|nr:hypothetical protein [Nitrosomonas sp.]
MQRKPFRNKVPRRKQRGINCTLNLLVSNQLSPPKEREIVPAEIKGHAYDLIDYREETPQPSGCAIQADVFRSSECALSNTSFFL